MGIERAVECIEGLVAAEEADVGRLRQLAIERPGDDVELSSVILIGAPSSLSGHRRIGVRSQTTGTTQS